MLCIFSIVQLSAMHFFFGIGATISAFFLYLLRNFHVGAMGIFSNCSTSHAIYKTVLVYRFQPILGVRVHLTPP